MGVVCVRILNGNIEPKKSETTFQMNSLEECRVCARSQFTAVGAVAHSF